MTETPQNPYQPHAHPQPTVPSYDTQQLPNVAYQRAVPPPAPIERKRRPGAFAAAVVAAALVVGAGAGVAGGAVWTSQNDADTASSSAPHSTSPVVDTPAAASGDGSIEQVAQTVLPSVVKIDVSGPQGAGSGSGIILTSDGQILTNNHVVELAGDSGELEVSFNDGTHAKATIVGTDPLTDTAVIQAEDVSGLTPATIGSSDSLQVGQGVVAIGSPFGLDATVTTGIVSALNRSIQIASSAAPDAGDAQTPDEQTPDDQTPDGGQSPFQFDFGEGDNQSATPSESISIAVIQTDAAINPGNSGGALVDEDGKLIGINVAIATAGGTGGESGSIGVGFSIPSNIVKRVTDEIIADGVATHGLLGASVQSAAAVEGATITGAYIAEVSPDGAAASAGLQKGDIVTEFNGVPITDSVDLTAQVRAAAAGSDATVTFVRDGETQTIDVTLGELQ